MANLSGMRSMWILALLTLCLNASLLSLQIEGHARSKRFLLFPRQAPTRHQFIAGIGIPADLSYESLTVGHVLKAEFWLPYNVTTFLENPFPLEYRDNDTLNVHHERQFYEKPSKIRWEIYEYIEHILNGYGWNGHQCLLKAICEANSVKFSREFSVVAELMHLLLSPSSSLNDNEDKSKSRIYIAAEKAASGSKGNDCEMFDCNISLLDWISSVMQL